MVAGLEACLQAAHQLDRSIVEEQGDVLADPAALGVIDQAPERFRVRRQPSQQPADREIALQWEVHDGFAMIAHSELAAHPGKALQADRGTAAVPFDWLATRPQRATPTPSRRRPSTTGTSSARSSARSVSGSGRPVSGSHPISSR